MSIFGFKWPWDGGSEESIEDLQVENAELRSELRQALDKLRILRVEATKQETEILRMKLILQRSHYRDPHTNRIGKMGARK